MTNLLFMAALAAANPSVTNITEGAWTQLTNRVQILWTEREERKARIEAMKKRRQGPPNVPFRVRKGGAQ